MKPPPHNPTPFQKRILIAEACGWTQIDHAVLSWRTPDGTSKHGVYPPDYLTSLDAMHEAERLHIMHNESSIPYLKHLTRISCPHFATASQRADVFGLTLNLWTQD